MKPQKAVTPVNSAMAISILVELSSAKNEYFEHSRLPFGLFLSTADGSRMFFRNVGEFVRYQS
jgi:hypothetical protein